MFKGFAVFSIVALAFAPTAAHAGTFYAYQGNDYAKINTDTENGSVHDKECDDNKVYAQVYYKSGWTVTFTDGNGCESGGKAFGINEKANSFRVCEDDFGNDSCSEWKYI